MLFDIEPLDLEDAVEHLEKNVNDEIKQMIVTHGSASMQDSLGRLIRHRWRLWNADVPFIRRCIEQYGLGNADDVSGAILLGLVQRLKGKDIDISSYVDRCRRNWILQGADPTTGAKLITLID